MKIYLDLIFLINFFFDFLLLFATKIILKEKTKLKRLLLGALIGSLSIFFLFLKINTLTLFLLKIVISTIMVLACFGKNNFLKTYVEFYVVSIFLGGGMYLLNQTFSYKNNGLIFFSNGISINLIVMIIISPFIISFYIKQNKQVKNTLRNCYTFDLYINKNKYTLKGYLDTGNTLKDQYKGRGIILMDTSKLNLKTKNIIYVPYKTITNNGVIPCIKPEKIVIDDKEYKNLLIGNIKNRFQLENADCILPNCLKEDLC